MRFLHDLYCQNCLHQYRDLVYEVSFYRSCAVSPKIYQMVMEYYCNVWAGAPSSYLESLNKLQKQICRKVGPSLNACFEALAHLRNEASFSIDITLLDLHPNWLSWFHFLNLEGGLLVILINCMNFLSPLLDATRMTLEFAYRMLSFDLWS